MLAGTVGFVVGILGIGAVVGVVGVVGAVGVVVGVVGLVVWVLGVAGPAGFVPQAAIPNTITTANKKAKILFINAIFLSISFNKQLLNVYL